MKGRWYRVAFVVGVAALLAGVALAAEPGWAPVEDSLSVPSERAPGSVDLVAYVMQQRALAAELKATEVSGASAAPFVVQVDRDQLRRLRLDGVDGYDRTGRKLLVGVVRPVGEIVSFADLAGRALSHQAVARRHGAIRGTDDGGFVWSALAMSPGATGLRVHLTDVSLPPGAELYIYTDAGEAFGPYTDAGPNGTGDFWTNTVQGSSVHLQLRHMGKALPEDLETVSFVVAEIGHLDPQALNRTGEMVASALSFCSFNASCVVNKNCVNTPSFVDNSLTDGVAHILFASGGFLYICSGGLLNDTDTSTQIPHFLTANHCISKGREASSMEAYFQFETPCNGTCGDPSTSLRTVGASIEATNRTGDFTLLKLSQSPPAGSVYLGWNNAPVAFTNGAPLYRLSHPKGAPQAYSQHAVDTSKGTCSSWPRGSWIYSRDIVGATEGGSSGSVVTNASGEVVGQLSGGCGTNVNDVCDSTNNATVDGALASYFSLVAPFLDASGGGGGGECLPAGSACTTNAECCSSSCKGKPGKKTCK